MTKKLIWAELQAYNEDEIFYRRCWELKDKQKALMTFLKSFDRNELRRRELIVPQLSINVRQKFEARYLFSRRKNQKYERDVFLLKHNRYTPIFKHFHDYFEIFFVLSGECVNTIEDKRMLLSAGSICFIAPGMEHSLEVFDASIIINILIKKITFDEIFFNLLTTNDIISRFFMGNLFSLNSAQYLVFDTKKDTEIREQLFDMLVEQAKDDLYSNRIMENRIEIFFAVLIRKYGKHPLIYQHEGTKDLHWDIIAYINENFRTVTLAKLAKRFNLSLSYCSRLIKSLAGKNFTVLVTDIKVKHAKNLLRLSNERIYNISYSLGFENQETFIRVFKKNSGLSPGQYRQNYT